ncbi:MAG: hypothetical protein JW874_11665 [Spirochaetales bacterium]|nr:hypothetical protein [Spirochaetales bacterium]
MKPGLIMVLHQEVEGYSTPDELDTLVQAEMVTNILKKLDYESVCLPASLDLASLRTRIEQQKPAAVFNLVESLGRKSSLAHLVPSLLEALSVPFTGSSTEAILITSNKISAKKYLKAFRLPTPEWQVLHRNTQIRLKPPFIIKSIADHASIGLNDSCVITESTDQQARLPLDPEGYFIEQYIPGREFNVAMLENVGNLQILPLAEIVFADFPADKPRIVNYAAKWEPDSFEYSHTPRRFLDEKKEPGLARDLKALCESCWRHFGLSGYARIDFRVDPEGRIWVLEINTNPCLSPDAGFMAAAAQSGYSSEQLVRIILDTLMEKQQ